MDLAGIRLIVLVASVALSAGSGSSQDSAQTQADSLKSLQQREQERGPIWAEGDVLTVTHRVEAEEVAVWLAGEHHSMERVQGEDLWFTSVELEFLSEGLMSYSFSISQSDGSHVSLESPEFCWRGPAAPPALVMAEQLVGEVREFELASQNLDAARAVTVYLPPSGVTPGERPPVVYLADGRSVNGYARVIEPLVLEGRLPEIVLVGVHNGGYQGDRGSDSSDYDPDKDLRAAEYLPVLQSQAFPKHEKFFCEEVPAWAERELGVSREREQRGVFGVSNGGRFAATMGVRHPDLFGKVFAFSIAAGKAPTFASEPETRAEFYLAAGIWEPFHERTLEVDEALAAANFKVEFSSRVAGHDHRMWQEEFAAAMLLAFGR